MANRFHFIAALAGWVYGLIFRQAADDSAKQFFWRLVPTLIGSLVSSATLLAVMIVAGRLIGPRDYGTIGIIQSIAAITSTFFLFGLDIAATKSLAQAQSSQQPRVISAIWQSFLPILGVMATIVWLLAPTLTSLLGVTADLLAYSIILAVALALKNLSDGIMRGLGQFNRQLQSRLIESGLAVAILSAAIGFGIVPAHPVIITLLVVSGVGYALWAMYPLIGAIRLWAVNRSLVYDQIQTGALAVSLTIFSLVILHGDKLALAKYLSVESVGIYSAYYLATILPASQLVTIVANVLLPMSAQATNARGVLARLDRFFVAGFVPVWIAICAAGYVVMRLYGAAYRLDSATIALFGGLGTLTFFAACYTHVALSRSKKVMARQNVLALAKSLAFVLGVAAMGRSGALSIETMVALLIGILVFDVLITRSLIYRHN